MVQETCTGKMAAAPPTCHPEASRSLSSSEAKEAEGSHVQTEIPRFALTTGKLGGAQDLLGLVDHTGFVGVGESAQGFADGEPLDDVVLAVVVGGVAADHLHQVEVDRLRVAYAAPHKPVVDLVQRPLDLHQQAGLFAHLADGGPFEGLAHLGCAFGQRPAARANASDECHLDRPTLRLATVDHPAGGDVAHRRPAITLAAASVRQPRGSGTCWSIRRAAARGHTGALSSLSTPPTPPRPSHR